MSPLNLPLMPGADINNTIGPQATTNVDTHIVVNSDSVNTLSFIDLTDIDNCIFESPVIEYLYKWWKILYEEETNNSLINPIDDGYYTNCNNDLNEYSKEYNEEINLVDFDDDYTDDEDY